MPTTAGPAFIHYGPCDFLFEDQIGARDAPTYAANASTPDPLAYTQDLIDVAARTASFLPTMTEGGCDRLGWYEAGFCNTLKLGWYSWPSSTCAPYPRVCRPWTRAG